MQSKIEAFILNPSEDYLKPYFYSNPFALRCELGVGDDADYMPNARRRASEIHRILFPHGADAMCFSQWIIDWSDSGEAEARLLGEETAAEIMEQELAAEARSLRFLRESLLRHRHVAVRGLKTYSDPGEGPRRNRIVCYSDGAGFDDLALIERQLADRDDLEISLVSFENECILSVYDDRGCDVVFADRGRFCRFYPLLRPYFLAYDLEEMEKRFREATVS